MTWVDFMAEESEGVLGFLHWLSGLEEGDLELAIGRIHALRELAANGELPDDDGRLKPIRTDPDIYELRWFEYGEHLRQYHAEPPEFPDHLVILHMHIKHLSPTSDEVTDDLQQQEINWAVMRYKGGRHRDWGI